MTAYVMRRKRPGPSLLDAAYAILRKGEAKAKKDAPEAEPVKAAAKKKRAAKKTASQKGRKV